MSKEKFGRIKAILLSASKTNHIERLNISDEDMNAMFFMGGNMVDLDYDDYESEWNLVLYDKDKKKVDYIENIDSDVLTNFIYKYRKNQE